jgi:NTP pyrophosphatase (non-canonical NTP hydrolase)
MSESLDRNQSQGLSTGPGKSDGHHHSPRFDLAAFQHHIAETYGKKDTTRGTAGTFMYLMEEVGELAEALREPDKHDVPGEFADCLAWLTSLAHLANVDLAQATAAKYPGFCLRCSHTPCTCDSKP